MDIYKGIHSEVVSSKRFDENSDISTIYLGRVNREMEKKNHFLFQNMVTP